MGLHGSTLSCFCLLHLQVQSSLQELVGIQVCFVSEVRVHTWEWRAWYAHKLRERSLTLALCGSKARMLLRLLVRFIAEWDCVDVKD